MSADLQATALEPGQYEYRGYRFGDGLAVGVRGVEGLEGFAAEADEIERTWGHGALPGLHRVPPRLPVFELLLPGFDLDAEWQDLLFAFRVSEAEDYPLIWRPAGGADERMVWARPILVPRRDELRHHRQLAYPRVALRCSDPHIYSRYPRQQPVTPYVGGIAVGGNYPGNYPKNVEVIGTGEVTLFNSGSSRAYPYIAFAKDDNGSGDATGVTLLNVDTGRSVEITTALAAGKTLVADMFSFATGAARQIIHIDEQSRYGSWQHPREPWYLPPGASRVRLTVDGDATGVVATLTWHDTSLG